MTHHDAAHTAPPLSTAPQTVAAGPVPAPRTGQPAPPDTRPTTGATADAAAEELMDRLADYDRLSAVARIDLLNPDLVARLDEVSQRTMTQLGREASYVSIVLDTAQLILSSAGMSGWICQAGGTPIEWSFCGHTVALGRTYTVDDASTHPTHHDSPLVTHEGTRAYAGVPLTTPDGHVLGAHCVIDSHPHTFTDDELAHLQTAAAEIVTILSEYTLDT